MQNTGAEDKTGNFWETKPPHFWATVCKTVCPMLSDRCPVLSVCDVGVLWPNRWRIEMKLGTQVGFGPGQIVLDGDPGPPSKRGKPQIFGPCQLWSNGWMD